MAVATLVFHGELIRFLAPRRRHAGAFELACARAATVKNAIESVGVPHTEVGRLTVNEQPATLARIVREGDRIEVEPPEPAQNATGNEDLRFIADAHLGALARFLRMLGFDTRYENGIADREIVDLAVNEGRIVLTRDRELLKCKEIARGCYVHALKPEAQLREVAARYLLERRARRFTLCLHCNVELVAIAHAAVRGRVPDGIFARYRDFMSCPLCERIYWQGSHWERMNALLDARLPALAQVNSNTVSSAAEQLGG